MSPTHYVAIGLIATLALVAAGLVIYGMYVFAHDIFTNELTLDRNGLEHSRLHTVLQIIGVTLWFFVILAGVGAALWGIGVAVAAIFRF